MNVFTFGFMRFLFVLVLARCHGLTLAGHQVPPMPLYHSPPHLDRGEKI